MSTSSLNDKPFLAIDGHVDLLYMMRRKWPDKSFSDVDDAEVTVKGLAEGRVCALVSAFYCEDVYNGPGKALPHLEELLRYAERSLPELPQIRSAGDLDACFRGARGPGVLHLLENADALADCGAGRIKERGFVAVGLTHAGKNRLGDGNSISFSNGLTSLGRRVVKDLNSLGMVLDVAHLSEPCFWEAAGLFEGPLITSHTGFRRTCDTPRNLSDQQLEILMARRGVVGVTFNPEMLAPDGIATLQDVVEQLDWLVQKYGPEGAALGSDFGGFDGRLSGLEHIGRLGGLGDLLSQRGYPDEAVAAIMGGNWYRLCSSVLPATFPPRSIAPA